MKKQLIVAVATSVLTCGTALADNHGDRPVFRPVEAYTCNYNDGMGPKDLDKAVADWNKWADGKGMDDYFAATMTPVYFGPDTFDFGWIGVSANGAAMGAGTDLWLNEGGEYAAKFAKVATCDTHSGFASSQVYDAADDDDEAPSDSFFVEFADCKITSDDPDLDIYAKFEAWSDFASERGYKGGSWLWWPVYGGGGVEYDFKRVNGYGSMADLGHNWDLMASGDYETAWEINDGAYDCDDSRVYRGTVRRRMAEE